MRLVDRNDPSTFQIFTGYQFRTLPQAVLTLAGYFEAFTGSGATAQRSVYGWYAYTVEAPG